jgi:aminoglycoside 6'-N-acetyltransferase
MSERGAVTLRPARPDDLPTVTRWDGEPHVIAASGVDAGEWDWPAMLAEPQPAWREMLIGEEAGRPVGIVQIIDPEAEETHYWGDVGPGHRAIDIWIGPKTDLGRGLGTEMMRLAIDRCFADPGVTTVLIDPLASNTRAHRFYRRLGFRDIGPRRFGDDDCVVMALSRSDWQRRHD